MKTFALQECEITGDERGDIRTTIAVSNLMSKLVGYCKKKFNKDISTLNSIGCPVPSTFETYYIIVETNIIIC